MNIVIANRYKDLLSKLEDVEVLSGTYNADSLVEMLRNFRYEKVIIDITAINNYTDLGNLRLLASLNPNSVVMFLDNNKVCSSKDFLAKLVNSGFYNFTRNLEGVKHLLQYPNTFDKVSMIVKDNKDDFKIEESVTKVEDEPKQENKNIEEVKPEIVNTESIMMQEEPMNEQNEGLKISDTKIESTPIFDTSIAEKKLNTFVEPTSVNYLNVDVPNVSEPPKIEGGIVENNTQASTTIDNDFLKYSTYNKPSNMNVNNLNDINNNMNNINNNMSYNINNINNTNSVNTNNNLNNDVNNNNENNMLQFQFDEASNTPNAFTEYEDITNENNYNSYTTSYSSGRKVIGVKNLTPHAGATSLIYMMYKELVKNSYNVIAIEVDVFDFMIYKEKKFLSVTKNELVKTIEKYATVDIILVDLNNYEDVSVCDEVLYLVEPSMVMLNKLMLKDKDTFKNLKGSKIILNKSLLDNKDINDFEYEAKTKVFYNMPPLSDRAKTNQDIINLLNKLQIKM